MRKGLAAACVACAVAATLYIVGCESGGGDSGPAGTSTVEGNVVSFSAGSAFYAPSLPRRGFARAMHDLGNLFVPDAMAAAQGVTVRMIGTDLGTTTADDGFFVMSGVPAGDHQMSFSMNGMTAIMNVNVPENATVHMDDISIHGSSAHAGHMSVEMHNSGGMHGPMMNN